MKDMRERTPKEDAEAVAPILDKKIGMIMGELQAAFDDYRRLALAAIEADNKDPETELALLEVIAYIGLLTNALSTLYRGEANMQAEYLMKEDGHAQYTLISKTNGARVKALKFIEGLVRETQDEALKSCGLNPPTLDQLKDVHTGRPITEAVSEPDADPLKLPNLNGSKTKYGVN